MISLHPSLHSAPPSPSPNLLEPCRCTAAALLPTLCAPRPALILAGVIARTLDGRLQHLEDGLLQHEVRLPGPPGAGPLLLLPGGRTLLAGTAGGSVVALPWPGTFPAGRDFMAGTGRVREQRLHGAPLTHMLLCPGTNVIATARWVVRPPRGQGWGSRPLLRGVQERVALGGSSKSSVGRSCAQQPHQCECLLSLLSVAHPGHLTAPLSHSADGMVVVSVPTARLEVELPQGTATAAAAAPGDTGSMVAGSAAAAAAAQLVLVPEGRVAQLEERLRQLSAAAANTAGEAEYQVRRRLLLSSRLNHAAFVVAALLAAPSAA